MYLSYFGIHFLRYNIIRSTVRTAFFGYSAYGNKDIYQTTI